MDKKKKVKLSNEKVVTISTDLDLFGCLVIVAKSRDVNLREVLCYELAPAPLALVHCEGTLRKTNKCVLLGELEKMSEVHIWLPAATSCAMSTTQIIDGMAQLQMMKSGAATT
jgi:hypothetical protein